MFNRMFLWAISSALAGFLFGFDTVVISGAEAKIQTLWSLSGSEHGFAISSALWGTVLGALIGSIPTNKFGRKKTLIFNGVLFFVSAIGSAIAWEVWSFSFFRFIGGVGIGISTIAAPLFISEISPADKRGRLTALFQFNIVFGILVAYLSNFIIGAVSPEEIAWRVMLGVEAVPAIIYTFMCFTLPESPRYLITIKGDIEGGRRIFRLINPNLSDGYISVLIKEVQKSALAEASQAKFTDIFTKRLAYPMLFAFLIAAFNQLSGINIILYFAPRLLGLAGMEDPLSAAIALGFTNLIFTYVGLKFIDTLGRRTLLILGCCGYIISLGVCTFAFVHFTDLKVVSASIDMLNSAANLERTTDPNVFMTDEDRALKRDEFAVAKEKFIMTLNEHPDILAAANGNVSDSNATGNSAALDVANNTVVPAETANSADQAAAATPAPMAASLVNASAQELSVLASAVKQVASERLGMTSSLLLACMILFIAAHALGSGTIIWVFISEIFPANFRAAGQSLGSFTHWIFAAILTLIFPIFIAKFDVSVMFGFFLVMMIAQLLWAVFVMPETKGKTLEELAQGLNKAKADANADA